MTFWRRSTKSEPAGPSVKRAYDAVVFDLLSALIDSWSLWSDIAGGDEAGLRWRNAYLEITYGAGEYTRYEDLVAEAAAVSGVKDNAAASLVDRWSELQPWPEASGVLKGLAARVPLAVATNCSSVLGQAAADTVSPFFDTVVTAEEVGFYKPRREPYETAVASLGTDPARTLFVAGSMADVAGASNVGMPVYWHNRLGHTPSCDVRPKYTYSTLDPLRGLLA